MRRELSPLPLPLRLSLAACVARCKCCGRLTNPSRRIAGRAFAQVVLARGLPFVLTCAAGVAWGVATFWYVAPRLLPDYWAERALVEFGVSIGATSTGLLLLRMADPDGKTPVLRDFTFKQIFHVLITGGGFFDVLVPIPLTSSTQSTWPLLVVCALVMLTLLVVHPTALRGCSHRRLRGANQQIGHGMVTRTVHGERDDDRAVGTAPAEAEGGVPTQLAAGDGRGRERVEVLNVVDRAL